MLNSHRSLSLTHEHRGHACAVPEGLRRPRPERGTNRFVSGAGGLESTLQTTGLAPDEAHRMARLVGELLARSQPPARPPLFSDYPALRDHLAAAVAGGDGVEVEERLLELYAHLHMNEAPYTADERRRMDAAGGYWNHAGGLSPILKAAPWVGPDTVSADFGAGNGLQGLLLQLLHPHRRTVQVEISARMAEIGDGLRQWLGIPAERVEWVVGDVLEAPATGYGFIYLYRPVRPEGRGRDFYARFAREVESEESPPIIFSVADCLRDFLSDRYEVFYGDGHLTCFKPRGTSA